MHFQQNELILDGSLSQIGDETRASVPEKRE